MKFVKALRNALLIIALFGAATAYIDYQRMINGFSPIFNSRSYNEKTKIETYRGMFYIAERKVKLDRKEKLSSSDDIKYRFLIYNLNIKKVFNLKKYEYLVFTEEQEKCDSKSKLLYADLNRKYYTYCIDSIKIKEQNGKTNDLLTYIKKDDEIIKELEAEMDFRGIAKDKSTQVYKSESGSISVNGLTMYVCNQKNINDVYIVPKNTPFNEKDFCTYKDDDFYFIWGIKEEEPEEGKEFPTDEEGNIIPEVFLEDATYRYEFSEPKKDRVFIVTPKVRGKEETKTPLMEIIKKKILTLEQLEDKGLVFNKIDKAKEKEELEKKRLEEEEKKKQEEEKKKQEESSNKEG